MHPRTRPELAAEQTQQFDVAALLARVDAAEQAAKAAAKVRPRGPQHQKPGLGWAAALVLMVAIVAVCGLVAWVGWILASTGRL